MDEEIDNFFPSHAHRDHDYRLQSSPSIIEQEDRDIMTRETEEREGERARRDRKKREQERLARAEKGRKRREQGRLEQEQVAQKRLEEQRREQEKVIINFIIRERGSWRVQTPVRVNPRNPSEIGQIARKYTRKDIRTLNTRLQMLSPQECFEAVINDRTHTILLV
ncbi:hypothetical protein F5882DRAFT_514055, partial [Hyaloscypha sp. PMI_1271]